MTTNCQKVFACAVLALGLTIKPAQAADAVVIANEGVAAANLEANALKDLLTGKTMYWPGGQAVVIILLPEKTDAALKEFSGMDASTFKTHWQRLGFSGRGQPPKRADDVEKLLAAVSVTKGAIALLPAGADAKGVKTIEVK